MRSYLKVWRSQNHFDIKISQDMAGCSSLTLSSTLCGGVRYSCAGSYIFSACSTTYWSMNHASGFSLMAGDAVAPWGPLCPVDRNTWLM